MINETHIGLVRMNGGQLIGVQYFESKWERNLGDVLTINGTKWTVGIIGDSRSDVISALNDIIKKQNSIINKQKYQIIKKERIETNRIWNKILTEVMEDLNKCGF